MGLESQSALRRFKKTRGPRESPLLAIKKAQAIEYYQQRCAHIGRDGHLIDEPSLARELGYRVPNLRPNRKVYLMFCFYAFRIVNATLYLVSLVLLLGLMPLFNQASAQAQIVPSRGIETKRVSKNTIGQVPNTFDEELETDTQLKLRRDKNWNINMILYGWPRDVDGQLTVDGVQRDIDLDYDELLDVLDSQLSGKIEFEFSRWGLYLDASYVKLSAERTEGAVQIAAEEKFTILELGGYYTIYRRINDSNRPRNLKLDLLLGSRWSRLETKVRLNGLVTHQDSDEDWFDSIVGLRLRLQVSPKWKVQVSGDVGGFGLSNSSRLAANGAFLFSYEIAKGFSTYLGYRYMYVDYSSGNGADSFEYDAGARGPVIGIGFKF